MSVLSAVVAVLVIAMLTLLAFDAAMGDVRRDREIRDAGGEVRE